MTEPPRLRHCVLAVVATAVVLGAPLLAGRLLHEDDAPRHLFLAEQQMANAQAGIALPFWATDLNFGFGSPALLFYPPAMPQLHAGVARVTGAPLPRVVGWVAVAALAGSGLAVLGWLRAGGLGSGAAPAAMLYMAAPYRLYDLYPRAALAENAAFVFPPLLLWLLEADLKPALRVGLVALATAGLALTSFPMTILFGALLAARVLLSPALRDGRGPAIAGAALAVPLAAFALAPAAFTARWLDTSRLYGSEGLLAPSTNAILGPDAGLEHSLVFVATAAVAALVAWPARHRPEGRFWVRTAALVAVAATPVGAWAWDLFPPLVRVQYPVRAAGLVILCAAPLAALLPARRSLVAVAVAVLVSSPCFAATAPGSLLDRPAPATTAPGSVFPSPRAVHDAGADLAECELSNPRYVEPFFNPAGMGLEVHRFLAGRESPRVARLAQRTGVLAGAPERPVKTLEWTRSGGRLAIEGERPDLLVVHQLWFPGHRVTLDGRPTAAGPEGSTGLLAVPVPAGSHEVGIEWRPPRPLLVARRVSAGAAILTGGLLGWGLVARRNADARG